MSRSLLKSLEEYHKYLFFFICLSLVLLSLLVSFDASDHRLGVGAP
jgi:uncharacterized YccA/Bax inhibitor family protein